KQTLNVALKEIEGGEAELRRSAALSGQYNAWQAELMSLDDQIAEREHVLDELRGQRDWLNKCRQARPSWFKRLEAERELARMGNWQPVPEDAVVRLEQLDTEQSSLLERQDLLALKREKHSQRMAQRAVAAGESRSKAGARSGSRIG